MKSMVFAKRPVRSTLIVTVNELGDATLIAQDNMIERTAESDDETKM